jgi:hypothetical protein
VGLAGHITLTDWPCLVAFPKNVLSMCPEEAMLKGSNAQRRYKEETWLPGQVAWPAGLTSGPPKPQIWLRHQLKPPKNTLLIHTTESVKKVRFSPL